jgi:hypothetical protein
MFSPVTPVTPLPEFRAPGMPAVLLQLTRWLAMCGLLVLAGCAAPLPPAGRGAQAQAPTGDSQTPLLLRIGNSRLELQVQGQTCKLQWRGEFPPDAVTLMNQALYEMEHHRCQQKILALDLQGGDIGPAITLGAMLKNRQFNTELLPGSYCHTPCVLVLAAGRQRLLPESIPPARLLLSQVRPDLDFGQATCATELSLGQQLTLLRYLRAMLPLPTATSLYEKIRQATCRSHETLGAPEALSLGLATGMLPAAPR